MNDVNATVVLPKKPVRRLWGRYVGAALLLAVGGTFLGWGAMQAWRRHQAQHVLDEAIAAVDRTDPGWRLEDLEAARKVVPNGDNPAFIVLEAKALVPEEWQPGVPSPKPQCLLKSEQVEELKADLRPLEPALAKAKALATVADGRFPSADSKNPLAESPGSAATSVVAKMLRMEAMVLAQSGDLEGAGQATLGIAGAARAIGDEPRLVAQQRRLQCRNELVFCVERLLGQGQPSEAMLARLQKALEEEEAVPACRYAIEGERAGHHQMALAAEAGDVDISKVSLLVTSPDNPWKEFVSGTLTTTLAREGHARMLPVITDLVALTRLPPEEQGAAGRKLSRSWNFYAGNYQFFRDLDKRILKVPAQFRDNLAVLRGSIVAVAAERYRRANNRWPAKVEDLTDGTLAPWATDPFGGAPLQLEKRKDGLTVLSQTRDNVPDT
ncbi:MAG TPA: hypothetical protein VKE94_21425, partial [Gemmataceae bacterium]|nr:hypothetical protein [Gemmataceae bacterium]